MEFFPPVIFEIKAKATEAIAAFGEINRELGVMEKNATVASARITKLEATAKYARVAVIGLGGAFAVLGVASLEVLDKVEKAQANLEVAVKNTGVSFEAALPVIKDHANAMKALGFTYEDTYDALAKMTAASGSPQMALDTLSTAADLARFKNISLADAGRLLARASIGQAKGLGDLGIAIGKTIPKGASLAQILKAVEDRAGGAANAFGNTLPGKMAIAKANFQALEVEIGTKLLPYAIKLTDWVTNTGIPKFKTFTEFLVKNGSAFKILGEAIVGFFIGSKITAGIMAVVSAVNILRDAYIATGIAAAFATGGVSVGTALTAVGAIVGTAAATYTLKKLIDGRGQSSAGTAFSTPMSISGQVTKTPDLTGRPVKVLTPTPKPSASPTVNQNITVYATNTNDIAKKLSKAAKNGVPVGSK
jgi:hypothetical protein